METWKDILGYDGVYQISDLGRVKSLKWGKTRIKKATLNSCGYLIVTLSKDGIQKKPTVHRLVWESFNGKTDLDIDHIVEGNKLDNRLCNLQAISRRSNIVKYNIAIGRNRKYTGVDYIKKLNKWQSRIFLNGRLKYLGIFKTDYDAHLAYQNELQSL